MKIRITSDGVSDTRVFFDDGKDIPYCYAADVRLRVGEIPKAVISVRMPTVDITADADVLVTFGDKQYRLVEVKA